MIYFLQNAVGHIKVGKTIRLSARKPHLESLHKERFTLIGVMPGSYKEETELHGRFAAHNVVNEWFLPHPDLLAFIEANAQPWDGTDEAPDVDAAKIETDVMRDARIVVAVTGEGLSEYLSRLLRPAVAKDKAKALEAETKPPKPSR